MTNRTNKQLEDFKELIDREWQLNLNEEEFLDSVFSLLLSRETKKAAEIVNLFYSEEWEDLLELIPENPIKNYAEFHYDMIDEGDCDCDEEKTLEDFDDWDIKEEYSERFGTKEALDIITEMNLSEMTDLFLSFSPQKQIETINLLKNEI